MGSGRSFLGSERPDLVSWRPDLSSEGLRLSGRLVLRLAGGVGLLKTETGEYCPMWNYRSSAPLEPLPKKHNEMRGYKLQSAKDVKNMVQIATKYRDS